MAKGRGHSWGKQGWAFGTLSPAFLEALDRREGPAKSNEQIGDARISRGCNCTATWESETHSSELNKSPEAQTRFFNEKTNENRMPPESEMEIETYHVSVLTIVQRLCKKTYFRKSKWLLGKWLLYCPG